MDINDQTVEKTELVIKALDYAHTNNLDIKNKEDVKKIIETLDSEHSSDEGIEEFMKLLQGADTLIQTDVTRRRSTN